MATRKKSARAVDVTPYLVVEKADGLIEFVRRVFDADELTRTTGASGGTHCEVMIGGTKVMIGGGTAIRGREKPGALHVWVRSVDATHERAIAAGAKSLYAPTDQEYGSRDSAVRDAFGNHWYIAAARDPKSREGMPGVTAYLHPVGAATLLKFIERALGAEVLAKHMAGGKVAHAQVRVGAAVLELSEAHGHWRPMPMMFYVTVGDADRAYEGAVAAGATSLSEPADLPYGRSGAVEDPSGNQWYLTAPKA